MKKMEVREVRKKVMEIIMKKEKEILGKAIDEIDGTPIITEKERNNNEKMKLMYEIINDLENMFLSLDKNIFKENK